MFITYKNLNVKINRKVWPWSGSILICMDPQWFGSLDPHPVPHWNQSLFQPGKAEDNKDNNRARCCCAGTRCSPVIGRRTRRWAPVIPTMRLFPPGGSATSGPGNPTTRPSHTGTGTTRIHNDRSKIRLHNTTTSLRLVRLLQRHNPHV